MNSTGSPDRILLYSHDTFGLGHLRRNLAIAASLLGSRAGRQVVLITGSTVSDRFVHPAGLTIVPIPPMVKVGSDTYVPRHPSLSASAARHCRRAIINETARRLRPDVFLVDHSPAGMDGELLDVLSDLRRHSPATRLALGLRDILDEPERVRDVWRRNEIYRLLDEVYDELYVYGSKDIFDIGDAYDLAPSTRERLAYCGYIDKPPGPASPGAEPPSMAGPYLLATAGGGGDGNAVLAAATLAAEMVGLRSLIVTGPLMEDSARAQLQRDAAIRTGTTVVSFHPALRSAMQGAALVVTMGGYNSLCEAVATGTPTVVVPRIAPRREQAMRAERFARRGLVDVVLPGPDLEDRLISSVAVALAAPRRARRPLDFGGLDRLQCFLDRAACAPPWVPVRQPA